MSRRNRDEYADFSDTEIWQNLGFGKDLIIDSEDEDKLDSMQQIIKEKILTERRDKLIDWAELKRIKRTDKERKDIALKDMKRKKQ